MKPVWSNNTSAVFYARPTAFALSRLRGCTLPMPWKKLLAWATGQIDEALRQKLEFVLEESHQYRQRCYLEANLHVVAILLLSLAPGEQDSIGRSMPSRREQVSAPAAETTVGNSRGASAARWQGVISF